MSQADSLSVNVPSDTPNPETRTLTSTSSASDPTLASSSMSSADETKSAVTAGPLPYHPLNTLATHEGYYGNLTEYQQSKLDRMNALLDESKLDYKKYLQAPGETRDHMMLRFLRARKFKTTAAWDMFVADFKWREERDVIALRDRTDVDVLGLKDMTVMTKYLPSWYQGFDKEGRPIIFKRFGNCNVAEICKETTVEKMLDHHIWQQERLMRKLAEQSAKTGYNVETVTAVFDASGWRIGLATRQAYSFLKGMADLDSAHYPERLGQIFIVNSPYMLAAAWRVIRSWLDDKTKEKVHILGSMDEYKPILLKYIDEDVLPAEFGGKALSLAPQLPSSVVMPMSPTSDVKAHDDAEGIAIAKELAGTANDDPELYSKISQGVTPMSPVAASSVSSPTSSTSASSTTTEMTTTTDHTAGDLPPVAARRSSWWPFGRGG